MDPQRLSDVLDILVYMAAAHIATLEARIEEHGDPTDISALEDARESLAVCARELAADFPELASKVFEYTSEDIVRDSMSEIVARHRAPKKS